MRGEIPRRLWWPVVALLLTATLFLHARSDTVNLPQRLPLAEFPLVIEDRYGRDVKLDKKVLDVLRADDVLVRVYQDQPTEPHLDLYVAYFAGQRTGATIHSPQNCLPGAGWLPVGQGRLELERPGGEAVEVNRYVIAKGFDRQFVLYWYHSHGRVVASEYWAKFFLVADAIRMNRTDGAIVRVITPIARGEAEGSAQQRAISFAEAVLPLLDEYVPR